MIVGTAGHIDHGKTSLVKALTGVDTDRLKEEKARGITIDLGFAYLPAPEGNIIGFVDVPGHERFVHTMVAGAFGIDFALLAVAADDGPMPQTREHIAIMDLLGVGRGLVAITKADIASVERLAEVKSEVAAVLAGTRLANAEILPVSAATGFNIEALKERLFAAANARARQSGTGAFRLAADRAFTLPGMGVIVTGTVLSGSVRVGDRVVVSPKGLTARVRSLHVHNRAADEGHAGERCALNLSGDGVSKDAIRRGDVVLDRLLHAPTDRIDVRLNLLGMEKKPLRQSYPARLHLGAADVGARIVQLEEAPAPGGAPVFVQLVLDAPVAATRGDRFVLRDVSAQRTIGGGVVLDPHAPARKRKAAERIQQLQALALPDLAGTVRALLDMPPYCLDWGMFARDNALSGGDGQALADRLELVAIASGDAPCLMLPTAWAQLSASLTAMLARFHADHPDLQGMSVQRLRLLLAPRFPEPAFAAALHTLASIAIDGGVARLTSHVARLAEADETLWRKIAPRLDDEARFRPPRVRDIAGELATQESEIRRLLKSVARLGRIDEVAHDHFFLRATVLEMVAIVAELAADSPDGEFTAAQFRDRVENGRKVAIQILEYFDRHGITLRRGDLRRIDLQKLDMFGIPPSGGAELQRDASRRGKPAAA